MGRGEQLLTGRHTHSTPPRTSSKKTPSKEEIEVPWDDDSRWREFILVPVHREDNRELRREEECLFNLSDGQGFRDAEGRQFTKACDGRTGSLCDHAERFLLSSRRQHRCLA